MKTPSLLACAGSIVGMLAVAAMGQIVQGHCSQPCVHLALWIEECAHSSNDDPYCSDEYGFLTPPPGCPLLAARTVQERMQDRCFVNVVQQELCDWSEEPQSVAGCGNEDIAPPPEPESVQTEYESPFVCNNMSTNPDWELWGVGGISHCAPGCTLCGDCQRVEYCFACILPSGTCSGAMVGAPRETGLLLDCCDP